MPDTHSNPSTDAAAAAEKPLIPIPKEVLDLFPPAPVLIEESDERFMRLWESVVVEMDPIGISEWMMSRHIAETMWETQRMRWFKVQVVNAHVPDTAAASLTAQVTEADLLGVPGETVKNIGMSREKLMANLTNEALIDNIPDSRELLGKICKSLGLTPSMLPALAFVDLLQVVERLDQMLARAERHLQKLRWEFERRRMIAAGPTVSGNRKSI